MILLKTENLCKQNKLSALIVLIEDEITHCHHNLYRLFYVLSISSSLDLFSKWQD